MNSLKLNLQQYFFFNLKNNKYIYTYVNDIKRNFYDLGNRRALQHIRGQWQPIFYAQNKLSKVPVQPARVLEMNVRG